MTPVPSFVAVTAIPATTAPLGSVTKPEILPVLICAETTAGITANETSTNNRAKYRIAHAPWVFLSGITSPATSPPKLWLTCGGAPNQPPSPLRR